MPDELFRRAKSHAAARGESLRDLFERAVSHELGSPAIAGRRGRVHLPLIPSDRPGTVDISNAQIDAIFAAEDAEKIERN